MGLIFNQENGLDDMKQMVSTHPVFGNLSLETSDYYMKTDLSQMKLGCKDINPGYVDAAFAKLKADPNRFDGLFLVDHQKNLIAGFIVIELGECKKHEHVWSVNIICSVRGAGVILLGSFLYCLKMAFIRIQAPDQYQFAVLELSGNYINVSGFMLYSKLGFEKDLSLFEVRDAQNVCNCFCAEGTLPMKADLSRLSPNEIRGLMGGQLKRINYGDDTGLYELYKKHPADTIPSKAVQEICNQLATSIVNFHKLKNQHPAELGAQFEKCKQDYEKLFEPQPVYAGFGEPAPGVLRYVPPEDNVAALPAASGD